MKPRVRRLIGYAVPAAGLVPFVLLVKDAFTGGLGANPVEEITHRTGTWTLTFLIITLTVTPLRHLTGLGSLIQYRRTLGLTAFFYACLHFSTYIVFDQFFSLPSIVEDVIERPYITVGFTSFLLLIPLALTSTAKAVKRLGGTRWRRLHRLSYVAAAGGVLHYLWLVKADITTPALFGLALVAVLSYRLVMARSRRSGGRSRRRRARRRARTRTELNAAG